MPELRGRAGVHWAVRASDAEIICVSCRLTRTILDLTVADNRAAWYRLEAAVGVSSTHPDES